MRRMKRALTLIELLITLAILAIVAGIAITSLEGTQTGAQDTVDLSNQVDLDRALTLYNATHNGAYPDGYDSVLNASDLTTIYDGDGSPNNQGFFGHFGKFTVGTLTPGHKHSLSRVGITTVYDSDTSVPDPNNSTSLAAPRSIIDFAEPNTQVIFIDPASTSGQQAYADFGQDPTDTSFSLVVFGIGPRSSLVGDNQGGLREAPLSSGLSNVYYNRYLAVFKIYDDFATFAQLLGVLDSAASTVTATRNKVRSS